MGLTLGLKLVFPFRMRQYRFAHLRGTQGEGASLSGTWQAEGAKFKMPEPEELLPVRVGSADRDEPMV